MIKIRFKKTGTKSRKQWRVVVVDSRTPSNGRLIEELGFYNPLVEPPLLRINEERYRDWIAKGARPSGSIQAILKKVKPSGDAH